MTYDQICVENIDKGNATPKVWRKNPEKGVLCQNVGVRLQKIVQSYKIHKGLAEIRSTVGILLGYSKGLTLLYQ